MEDALNGNCEFQLEVKVDGQTLNSQYDWIEVQQPQYTQKVEAVEESCTREYYFRTNTPKKNWTEARDACKADGMDLASINSETA